MIGDICQENRCYNYLSIPQIAYDRKKKKPYGYIIIYVKNYILSGIFVLTYKPYFLAPMVMRQLFCSALNSVSKKHFCDKGIYYITMITI